MTCIAAVSHEGFVYMAGDSCVTANADTGLWHLQKEPKVFRRGDYVIGICGATKVEMLLKHFVEWPAAPSDNLERHMNVEVAAAMNDAVRRAGYEFGANAEWLVGVHDQLFTFDGTLCAYACREDYVAIGCGRLPALGALHALSDRGPRARLAAAMRASAAMIDGVKPPFHWVSNLPRRLPPLRSDEL